MTPPLRKARKSGGSQNSAECATNSERYCATSPKRNIDSSKEKVHNLSTILFVLSLRPGFEYRESAHEIGYCEYQSERYPGPQHAGEHGVSFLKYRRY